VSLIIQVRWDNDTKTDRRPVIAYQRYRDVTFEADYRLTTLYISSCVSFCLFLSRLPLTRLFLSRILLSYPFLSRLLLYHVPVSFIVTSLYRHQSLSLLVSFIITSLIDS
jgi:hypothetical protein